MIIEIKEQIYLYSRNIPLLNDIKSNLKFKNPSYEKTIALGYSAHNVPTHYHCYQNFDKGLIVPRGAINLVIEQCKLYAEPLKVKDSRTVGAEIDVYLEKPITPYWYQQNAINAILEKGRGIIVGPCGCGKSLIAMFTTIQAGISTLIIVHTSELYRQWKNEIESTLGGKFKVGFIGDGKRIIGDITIAMVQTLCKLKEKEWKPLRERVGITFFDEGHHCAADSYIKVMENIQSKIIIALTATPRRNDKKDFLIKSYLGEKIYEIYDHDLETCGKSIPCVVNWFHTNVKLNYTKLGNDHIKFSGELAKNLKRSRIIIENVKEDLKNNIIPMVIVDRKVHARILIDLLEEEGITVSECTGSIDQLSRDRIRGDLTSGKTQVLVANKQIAAEGMNIPCLGSVHIVFYITALELVKQIVGRTRRPYGDKEKAIVWFYVDNVVETDVDEFSFTEAEIPSSKFKFGYSNVYNYFRKLDFEVISVNKEK